MQSQLKWYTFRHGMTSNWKWNNLQHIQICIRSGKWKRIKYLREIVSRYAITAKMVLFQTRNDVKLKMKQFTTHSNLYQVGQVKKNLIFKEIVSRYAITAKMVLFQTRNDVKLKMKQFTTHSNLYQVGQVKKNLIFKGNS